MLLSDLNTQDVAHSTCWLDKRRNRMRGEEPLPSSGCGCIYGTRCRVAERVFGLSSGGGRKQPAFTPTVPPCEGQTRGTTEAALSRPGAEALLVPQRPSSSFGMVPLGARGRGGHMPPRDRKRLCSRRAAETQCPVSGREPGLVFMGSFRAAFPLISGWSQGERFRMQFSV